MAEQTVAAPSGATKGPGLVREYETIYLTRQDIAPDALDKIKERVKGIVEREGGRVIKVTTWGKKKTSFPIKKQARAVYVHVSFLGGGSAVAEVERNLRNIEEVTKFQTVRVAEMVNAETRPTEADVVLEGDREEERPVAAAPAGKEGAPGEVEAAGVEAAGAVEAEAAGEKA